MSEKVVKKRISGSTRAGLLFPVRKTHLKLKELTDKRVSPTATVFLAGVLEYLTAEVIEAAAKNMQDSKKKKNRISPRSIYLGMAYDSELQELTKDVIIPGGGVVPMDVATPDPKKT